MISAGSGSWGSSVALMTSPVEMIVRILSPVTKISFKVAREVANSCKKRKWITFTTLTIPVTYTKPQKVKWIRFNLTVWHSMHFPLISPLTYRWWCCIDYRSGENCWLRSSRSWYHGTILVCYLNVVERNISCKAAANNSFKDKLEKTECNCVERENKLVD